MYFSYVIYPHGVEIFVFTITLPLTHIFLYLYNINHKSDIHCTVQKRGIFKKYGAAWPWSYGSWIYNYLCNQCLSPLKLWVRISIRARCTTLCDKVCQWLATGRRFSLGIPVSSTNKTDRHHIIEILLTVALNTIKQTNKKYVCLNFKVEINQPTYIFAVF